MNTLHPNDRIYAIERAIRIAEIHDREIVGYLRQMLDEARRNAAAPQV